jgi:hypothetical protein
LEKTCPSATLSTTNPTSIDPGLNPGWRGGKPATNRLSYGAAYEAFNCLLYCFHVIEIQQQFIYIYMFVCLFVFFFLSLVQSEFKTTTFNSVHMPGEHLNVLYVKG